MVRQVHGVSDVELAVHLRREPGVLEPPRDGGADAVDVLDVAGARVDVHEVLEQLFARRVVRAQVAAQGRVQRGVGVAGAGACTPRAAARAAPLRVRPAGAAKVRLAKVPQGRRVEYAVYQRVVVVPRRLRGPVQRAGRAEARERVEL